jgi:anaerobic ribonucleoside-triphosphate reductase activating protein
VPVQDLYDRILASRSKIEGITLSGGEPLQQLQPLLMLLRMVRENTMLSIVLFTGYTLHEVQQMAGGQALLGLVDILIAGRYDASQHLAISMRGSANQTLHFLTSRYSMTDVLSVPSAEILIEPTGDIVASGIDPIRLTDLR